MRHVRATPPPAPAPRPAPPTVVRGHPAAVTTARELARRGQWLVAQEDGSVLVVNVPVYGPPLPAWRAATP